MNNLIKDIKLIIQNKKLLICLICSIIAICGLGVTYRYNNVDTDTQGIVIGVVNNDNSPYSDMLLNFFKSNDSFSKLANIVEDNQITIKKEFDAGNIDAYILIPKDFADSLQYLENTQIKIRINQEKEVEAIVLKAVLSSYERYVTSVQNNAVGLYRNLKKSGLDRKTNLKINLISSWEMINMAMGKESYFDYKVIKVKNISLIEHYIYTIILIVIIYYGIYVGVQIKKEQGMGVLKLYTISKGSKISWILSKICAHAISMCICMTAAVAILSNILCKKFNVQMWIFVMINTIMYITIMTMIALIIKSKNLYILVANMCALFIIIVGGGIIPEKYMPQNMLPILSFLPIKIFEEHMNQVVIDQIEYSYLVYMLIMIVSICIGIMALGRRVCNERV